MKHKGAVRAKRAYFNSCGSDCEQGSPCAERFNLIDEMNRPYRQALNGRTTGISTDRQLSIGASHDELFMRRAAVYPLALGNGECSSDGDKPQQCGDKPTWMEPSPVLHHPAFRHWSLATRIIDD
jgi:hypothetical protein